MEVTLKGVELECAKKLAKLYDEGKAQWQGNTGWEELALTEENFSQVLGMMELVGAIRDVSHASGAPYFFFNIDARAVQIARSLEAQEVKQREGKDILEDLKVTLKKHPVAGRLIAAVAGIVLLATAITQIHGALKAFGLVSDPPVATATQK